MIDFEESAVFHLGPCQPEEIREAVEPIFVPDEEIIESFKAVRDFVVFTNKRLITANIEGITGKKRDFTSLPYRTVQAFSIETAGVLDRDCELDLWFSGLGKVRLEFKGAVNIRQIGQIIASHAL